MYREYYNLVKKNKIDIYEKKYVIFKVGYKSMKKDLDHPNILGIQFVNNYKYLGITIDPNLRLAYIFIQLKKSLCISLAFLENVSNVKIRIELWKIYVKSIIQYSAKFFYFS